ncbi:alpha-N-acetylglucosaminidase TIM-barrel domain-containing protein [Nonomuraea sp. NPDC049714]|uniref:alpha-N-acetylglucosaminidase n=1 Tax=Nonomuraea sp. NPDC049714 TaxID=3364357 RepID=UPI0037A26440
MPEWIPAAQESLRRLAGPLADAFDVRALPGEDDRFEIYAQEGRTVLAGTGPVAVASGFAHYLRHVARGEVSRWGDHLPASAPPPGEPLSATSPYRYRVAYNITVAGYTTPFYDWDQWQRELDLLAASGVNAAHLTLGQEAVWLEAFGEFGYTESELLAWIVPPSHQPWQWLNNMHSFGGGTTRELVERRAELALRVLARMRELGIRPILPGFSGTVPGRFADRNPGATVIRQGLWFMDVAGPPRPDWLDTSTPHYAHVAEAFYRHQHERFGRSGTWAVDLLHEGGRIGDTPLADAASGVERAMRVADPDYLWVVQAWAGNPRKDLFEACDQDRMLVLDLTGDAWRREGGFWGAPWGFGILPNYGGRHGLYGSLPDIAAAPGELAGPLASGELVALTNMAEGVHTNPVVWDLFADLAWTREPVDLDAWLEDWVHARYGSADPDALDAWRLLRSSAYATWGETASMQEGEEEFIEKLSDFKVYACTDSVFAATPSLTADQASAVGPHRLHYDPAQVEAAWRLLLEAAPRLRDSDTYLHDLVDVTRQILDDRGRALAPHLAGADAQRRFLRLIDIQDRLLATRPEYLLGRWLRDARRWGADEAQSRQLERAAKRLVTVWGGPDSAILAEYANRNWAGLMNGYYRARWKTFFEEGAMDWNAYGQQWADQHADYPAEPCGDPIEIALEIFNADL